MWSPGQTLADIEKIAITEAMSHHGRNKTKTANALGISVRTLDARLEIYEKEKKDVEVTAKEVVATRAKRLREARWGKGNGPKTGDGVEPAAQVSTELAMPVPVGRKIQEVLSAQAEPSPRRKNG